MKNIRSALGILKHCQNLFGKTASGSMRQSRRKPTLLTWDSLEERRLLAADAGWVGSYYAGSTPDSSPALVQHDALIDFDWGERSALSNSSNSDGSSARWESNLRSDHTATHQLIMRMNSNDGLRLWVDGQLVVDQWNGTGTDELVADVPLVAGQAKAVKIEYRDITGQARLWVGWTSPQLPKEVVGPEWTPLTQSQQDAIDAASPRGILLEQLSTVGGNFLNDGDVEYSDIASGTRVNTISTASSGSTHPAQRARGYIVPAISGNYQFRISGGDANRFLLADDESPELARVIAFSDSQSSPGQWNVDANQTSATVSLVAGVRYYFEARQTDSGSYDGLQVQWRHDGSVWENISNDRLRPLQAKVGVRAVYSAVNETDGSTTLSIDVSRTDDFGRALVVALDYGGTATRGTDYTGALPTVTIPAGQRSVRMDIVVTSDNVDEVLETIQVGVASSLEYELTSPIRTRTTLSIFGNLVPLGNSLIPNNPLLVSNIGQATGTNVAFTNRTAINENGGTINGTVLIVDTTMAPANAADAMVSWDINQDVTTSETLYAEFYYRRIGTPWSPLVFEIQDTASSDTWGQTSVTAKGSWQRVQIPIEPGESLSSDSVKAELRFSLVNAKVEIANFQVKRFVNDLANSAPLLPIDAGSLADVDSIYGQGTYATFDDRAVTGEGVPFTNALNIDVPASASFLSQIGAAWNSDVGIAEGSIVTAEVWLRTDDPGFDVRLQVLQASAASQILLKEDLDVTGAWTKHQFSFLAREESVAGGVNFEVIFGRSVGTVEIGGIQLFNHGTPPNLSQFLPQSYESYAERESDSDWRWEAQQNVLDNRRHELAVKVTDLAGNPISGASVTVNQIEHAYEFGNIIKSKYVSDIYGQASTAESLRHQAIAARLFNTMTIADGLRWRLWDISQQRAFESAQWANDNVDSLHGHHLTWGQLSQVPGSVQTEYDRLLNDVSQSAAREYLRTQQLAHVAEISSALDGLGGTIPGTDRPIVAHWDTVNHPVLLKEIWNILRNGGSLAGPIGEVFDTAAANAHADTLLMINEGQTIERVGIPRRTEYFELIEELLLAGKPVEAIGFMNHFGFDDAVSPTQLDAYLDEFAALGLPLMMTEFDINSSGTDLQTQADWSEDYFLNVFSNPATTGIIGYGFWELAHWRKDSGAHWYSQDWEAKPNADVYVDQIHRQWQTNISGSTRTDGTYRTMAFDGRQQVTVTVNGLSYQAVAEVAANGGVANVLVATPRTVTDGTRIEAEAFDLGGEGVAYHDTSSGNNGGETAFRATEDVDVATTTDNGTTGNAVGWIAGNEWLQYTADVVADSYNVSARVASNNGDPGNLRLQISDGAGFQTLGTFAVESSGGWENWTTVTLNDIDLIPYSGADKILRLEMVGGNFNVNWFEFEAVQSQVAPTDITLSNTSINENLSTINDRFFANLDAVDGDANDSHVFSLAAGTGDADNAKFKIAGGQLLLKQGQVLDYENQSSYAVRLKATDSFGLEYEESVVLTVNNLVEVDKSDVTLGDSGSRSRVTTVSIQFDGQITFDPGAFVVTRRGPGGGNVTVTASFRNGSNNSIVDLTFSGSFVEFGSLKNGNYELEIVAGKVHSNTGHGVDSNGDGTDTDTLRFGDHAIDKFFRMYGDHNGDRAVNYGDYLAFRSSYGKMSGAAGYLGGFDYNNDGVVNYSDYLAFRSVYGSTLVFV